MRAVYVACFGCRGCSLASRGRGELRPSRAEEGCNVREIYKITYPNGKIYVGMDLTGTSLYFGSPRKAHIAEDLGRAVCRDLAIRKQTLWESATAREAAVREMARHCTVRMRANDPKVGYNTSPRFFTG